MSMLHTTVTLSRAIANIFHFHDKSGQGQATVKFINTVRNVTIACKKNILLYIIKMCCGCGCPKITIYTCCTKIC
ncbi:hypothetical protein evm_004842 [Chilo suppressalis]|nr:hypothetical protein evm_004842 [Chilo suppressalis]